MMEAVWKFVHMLGVTLFVGGVATATICRYAANSMSKSCDIAMILGVARKAVPLVAVGLIFALISGCVLVDHEYSFSDGWVSGALALVIWMFVVGGVAGRSDRLTRELAEAQREHLEISDELKNRLTDKVTAGLNVSMLVTIIIMLVLMVWKPA
jgi:small-conductance mechanosensitive channel